MDINSALQSQIRNIEATYGHPLAHWFDVIDASGLAKHNEVVAMLKSEHGLAHGAAHRVSLLARERAGSQVTDQAADADPADTLYIGAKAALRPLHDAILAELTLLGECDAVLKKGYLSLRRRKQFAMVAPSTSTRIDVGLIMPPGTPVTERLESSAKFNALFTHRVRVSTVKDIDSDFRAWLKTAFDHSG